MVLWVSDGENGLQHDGSICEYIDTDNGCGSPVWGLGIELIVLHHKMFCVTKLLDSSSLK
jgi:hypothetical protein